MKKSPLSFTEQLAIRKLWIWAIVLPILAVLSYSVYTQLVLGVPFGTKPVSSIGLVIGWLVAFSTVLLIYLLKLKLNLDANTLQYNMLIFGINKKVAWTQIKSLELTTINALTGYGYRLGNEGVILNMGTPRGLKITDINGQTIVLSVKDISKLENFLSQIMPIYPNIQFKNLG